MLAPFPEFYIIAGVYIEQEIYWFDFFFLKKRPQFIVHIHIKGRTERTFLRFKVGFFKFPVKIMKFHCIAEIVQTLDVNM